MQEIWDSVVGWSREHLSDWTLIKVYMACAVAGGSVLIGQTGLSLFGLGGGEDVDADMDVDDIEGEGGSLSFLSIRALSGFLTFFGLIGWGGTAAEWGTAPTFLASMAGGGSVMFLIAWTMRFFQRLQSHGNLDPSSAVGKPAHVYLKIPSGRSGKGKITVSLQGRSCEFEAVSPGPELPSGSECRIVRMITEDTFEVAPLE